jgi:hypothetical protein
MECTSLAFIIRIYHDARSSEWQISCAVMLQVRTGFENDAGHAARLYLLYNLPMIFNTAWRHRAKVIRQNQDRRVQIGRVFGTVIRTYVIKR